MSDSLQPHLQHAWLPCTSLSLGVCSNSGPLSQWCYVTTSSSAVPSSFFLQSFPASGSFPMSQLFASGGQSIEASASTSFLPVIFMVETIYLSTWLSSISSVLLENTDWYITVVINLDCYNKKSCIPWLKQQAFNPYIFGG